MKIDNSKLTYLKTIINKLFLNKWHNTHSVTNENKKEIIAAASFSQFKNKFPRLFKLFLAVLFLTLPVIIFGSFTLNFIKVFIKYSFHKKQVYKSERLFILSSKPMVKIARRASLFTSNDHLLLYPIEKYDEVPVKQQVKIYDIITYRMIFSSYRNSFQVFFIIIKRFGYMNSIYSSSAYSWFLLSEALQNLDIKTEIFIGSQKDRWALLFDKLPHKKKNIIQHGSNIIRNPKKRISDIFCIYSEENNIHALSMPIKLSNISKLYAFNEIEAKGMILGEHKALPKIEIIGSGVKLKKLYKNKPVVLIIGHFIINASVEDFIINYLQKYDIYIYLKPHPSTKKNSYKIFSEKYNFTLIDDNSFIEADLVFSYNSTLAYEYENQKIRVVYYNDIIVNGKLESIGRLIDGYFI